MDWHQWVKQQLPYTEIKRGGATVWAVGANGLLGDSLGPILHIHDDASEIFYFISGRCRLEIGDTDEIFEAGDFVLVPPEVPHNLWNGGDEDLLVFWLVAPNFINNKWRTDNFPPGAMSRRAMCTHTQAGVALPSDAQIRSRLFSFSDGQRQMGTNDERHEAVIYMVEGDAEVKVGKLSGRLSANDFVPVLPMTEFSVTAVSAVASFIRFDMPGDS